MAAWLLVVATGVVLGGISDSFVPGTSYERVESQVDLGKSYALYLPSTFEPNTRWPVLFCLDPRGRGMVPIELFRPAAERHGFIIASSNDFFSDGEVEPAWEAIVALLGDVSQRFPIDPAGLYATGFSGGGRMIWMMAEQSATPFSGLIGVGAGFPWASMSDKLDTSRLSYYGIVGDTDFNFYEVQDLDRTLTERNLPHRIVAFEGRHTWPPVEEVTRAFNWMVVERSERVPLSEAGFLDEYIRSRIDWSIERERSGDWVAAVAELEDLLRQVEEHPMLPEVNAALERQKRSEQLVRQVKQQKRQRQFYEKADANMWRVLERLRNGTDEETEFHRMVHDLDLRSLLKRADSENREERLAARRVLESVSSQTGFYIARDLKAEKAFRRLQTSLRLALEVSPTAWYLHYGLARAYALDKRYDKAIEALQLAAANGFDDWQRLESDSDLEGLRSVADFRGLIEQLKGGAD